MVDFSKLRVRTPEERAREAEAEARAEVLMDTQRRRELSKRTIDLTLTHDAECRSSMDGRQIITLRGIRPDARAAVANYFVPSSADVATVNGLLDALTTGRRVRLDGYWNKRTWLDRRDQLHVVWEFMAQFVTPTS